MFGPTDSFCQHLEKGPPRRCTDSYTGTRLHMSTYESTITVATETTTVPGLLETMGIRIPITAVTATKMVDNPERHRSQRPRAHQR